MLNLNSSQSLSLEPPRSSLDTELELDLFLSELNINIKKHFTVNKHPC